MKNILFILGLFLSFSCINAEIEVEPMLLEQQIEDLLNTELNTFDPEITIQNGVGYRIYWGRKNGDALKKDQWWAYCEQHQSNYLKIQFYIVHDGNEWPLNMYVASDEQLLFYNETTRAYVYLSDMMRTYNGYEIPRIINDDDLSLILTLESLEPVITKNDSVATSRISDLKIDYSPLKSMFSCAIKFTERTRDYFHISFKFMYRKKILLKEGFSSPFKLNNPRWPSKLKKKLSNFTADEIFFMNLISGNNNRAHVNINFGIQPIESLCDEATKINFKQFN